MRILSLACAAVIGLLIIAAFSLPESAPDQAAAVQASSAAAERFEATTDSARATPPGLDVAGFNEEAFISDLRARFAPHLHRQHAQIRSLEQLIAYLKAHYPDDWQTRVQAFLQRIFPLQAEALYARFEQLMDYNAWLREHRDSLTRMSRADRQRSLWQARHASFGADADAIWAAEKRSQELSQALRSLPPETAPDEAASRFRASIEAIYGDRAEHLLNQRRTELVGRLLDQPSLQQKLRQLPASERRQQLRAVRQTLGMNEDALERWSQLDQQRDQAWLQGQAYMQAREALMQSQPPEQQQAALQQLRREHFGDRAELIAQEETGGFFRFAGERQIGRE